MSARRAAREAGRRAHRLSSWSSCVFVSSWFPGAARSWS